MSDAPTLPEPELGAPKLREATLWEPPPTRGDRLSPHLRRAVKVACAGVLGLALGAQLLWAIPTWIASQDPGFQALRAKVETDWGYQQALFGHVEADAWPESYTLSSEPGGVNHYTLVARGPRGVIPIRIEAQTRGGELIHVRSRGIADWSSAWRARKASR